MFDKNIFAQRFRELRVNKKLSQDRLATDLSVTKTYVSDIERARRTTTLEKCGELANYFDVPVDYLTGQGIFAQWDALMEHKGDVFDMLMEHNPVFCKMQLDRLTEKDLMRLFAGVLSNVTISEDGAFSIDVYPFWIDRP